MLFALTFISVSYCCITNCPKLCGLLQCLYYQIRLYDGVVLITFQILMSPYRCESLHWVYYMLSFHLNVLNTTPMCLPHTNKLKNSRLSKTSQEIKHSIYIYIRYWLYSTHITLILSSYEFFQPNYKQPAPGVLCPRALSDKQLCLVNLC